MLAMMGFSGRICLLIVMSSISLAAAINYCPPVWTQYQLKTGSFCYRLFSQPKTWLEAEATCRRYTLCQGFGIETMMKRKDAEGEMEKATKIEAGGEGKTGLGVKMEEMETAHLVSIGSAEEEDFVSSYWKEMRGPFMDEQGIWLGKRRTTLPSGSLWTWLDNLRAPYENWGTLANTNKAGNCSQQVATQYAWPRWERVDCDAKQPFICKMHAL